METCQIENIRAKVMREHFVSNSIIRGVQNKGVNFVSEAIPVWLSKRNISVPINIGVPFQNYRYK